MHRPLKRPLFILIAATALLFSGCSSTGGATLQSETSDLSEGSESGQTGDDSTDETESDTAESTTSTTAESTTTTTTSSATASAEAEAFKELVPGLGGVSDEVSDFAAQMDPVRIDELAASACSVVRADMTDAELGLAGLTAYDELTAEESTQINQGGWVVFYGALVGFFCPEQLPSIDLDGAPSLDGSTIDQFRAILTQTDGISAQAATFADGLTDERLDELQALACQNSNSDMTTEQFGLAIIESYSSDLTDAESGAITLAAYSELYGAFVGWFCTENLPL